MVVCAISLNNLSSNRTEMERLTCSACCDFMTPDTSHSCLSRTRLRVHRGRTRAPSPGDGVLVRCCMVTLLILHSVTVSCALETRISSTDPGGVVVFNASLGHGWSYHVDESKSKSSLPFLQLDSSTGLVYLRGGKERCQNLIDNPVQLHVVSKTWHSMSPFRGSNLTIVPYSVFIQGCKKPDRTLKFDRLKNKHRIMVSSQCIQPHTSLIKLTDFLPHSFQQCEITVDMPMSSPVYVNESNLVFLSSKKMCLADSGVSIEFNVSVLCDHSQEFQVPFLLTVSFLNSQKPRRRVRRAANNKPVFNPTNYIKNVKEEQPPGMQVITVTATDTDSEGAGTLTYSMIPASDDRSQSQFSINPLTGTINTTTRLDRESMRAHYFLVFATDHGIPPQSASATLTINVDDVNDHAPEFDQPVYSIEFAENQPIGSPVKTIGATDRDYAKNSEIRYSIVNPASPNDAFIISPVSGAISTMKRLDREKLDFYQLLIQAVDQGDLSERKSSTATVNITITDKNDNSPVFAKESYIVKIREDATPNNDADPIIQVSATDKDIGDNARIEYVLSGNTQGKFRIDSTNGAIFLVDSLDYEDEHQYSLSVRAEDQGMLSRRTIATVLVQVEDVNDNAPVFSATSYSGSVVENSPSGTSIIQVQAFDSDSGENSKLTYSLVNNGDGLAPPLSVNPQTGWIRTSGDINREHKPEYRLTVQVTDNGDPKRTASTLVIIGVHDTNDNAPIFTSRYYQASVSEEARIGKEVLRVIAQDSDEGENARVTYEITAGDSGHYFQMTQVNNQGLITVKRELDARQQNRYTLTVTAKDTGNLMDTVQVLINVTDTNRYAPEFLATPFQFSVDENVEIGKSVFKVKAVDQDRGENARITYSLDPGVTAFSINPKSGVISTRVELNREDIPGYMLRVTATDNGKPQKQDSEDIDVTINDENDNKPEFTETVYSGEISEDALRGASVLRITARDFDTDANGHVYYTFKGGNDGNGDFNIDSANGDIRVAKALDRERVAHYELVALAIDRGIPPQSSSVVVNIKILDVNDNRPEFASRELDVYIAENSPIGSTVARINATDPDDGVNALVEYSFEGGADVDSFELWGRRGEPAIIRTRIPLDYELGKKRYEVTLRATSDTLFSTTTVYIHVRDVNDHVPELKDFTIIYNNFGGSFPRGPIGRIPAYDPDVIDQELLTYRILSGNEAGLLHLNSSTGQITLDSRLNSDVPRNGTFKISVSDGKNKVKATCQMYVRLVTPEMLHDSVTIRLNKMTETAFLSSLLKFFTDALASIFNTDPINIFIINIENDTDVAPAQILNVSVSVRKGFVSEQGRMKDVFYSPEYLREYIYLYRAELANRSALQVLPFDDNLCLVEPCPSFSVCMSKVYRGEPRPFISSDTVLFRPIHPENFYKCVCPRGFAGLVHSNDCDTEVDLCYSMPCQNGGTCHPHEGECTCTCKPGFTGERCEVNMTNKYDSITCPQSVCRSSSVCVPLIRGGFRCDGCPDDGNYDEFCRLKTRYFKKGSYLTFPSLKARNRFTIKLKFATLSKNGILLYNGRFNEEHDFVGLEIINSQVTFTFSLGSNQTSVSTYVPGGVSTGDWFPVIVDYHQRVVTLTVGEDCDTNIAIMYGERLNNYSCAARVTHVLPAKCDKSTVNCHRLLDLTGPLQLGGLPWAPTTGQVTQQDFTGCISNVEIDGKLLDLNASVVNNQTHVGCPQKRTHCQSAPCLVGGKCQEGWNTYTCECPEKSGNKDCSLAIEKSRQLKGNGYLRFSTTLPEYDVLYSWYNGMAFRTRATSGTLMQITLSTGRPRFRLVDGFVQYSYGNVSLTLDDVKVNDGRWHYVEARWNVPGTASGGSNLELLLDYGQRSKSLRVSMEVSGSILQSVHIGGYPEGAGSISDGFVGCVKDFRVGNNPTAKLSYPYEKNVEDGCTASNPCSLNPCGPGTCLDMWGEHLCICPPGAIGERCEDVCSFYNPCENWAECKRPAEREKTYTCECGSRQSGRYCQNAAPLECPAAWWGNPVCGPCNCDTSRGYDKNCDKKNGTCFCKELHYQPVGSNECFPCDCYLEGSEGPTCNPLTGRCHCKPGILGRRCDQCDNKFAGISLIKDSSGETKTTCRVTSYDNCPRNYAMGMWWDPVPFGETAVQDCPEGSSGTARRGCKQTTSWLPADLFNCTSDNFTRLEGQLEALQEVDKITPYSANLAIELLKNATNSTRPLYGGDILMTIDFTKAVLKFENNPNQTGLSLISEQHGGFIQQLVIALSNVTSPTNTDFWPRVNKLNQGAATLLRLLEQYLEKIAKNMHQAQSAPFEAVSDGIVFGADWLTFGNGSSRSVPKYDNIINKGSANNYASILLPKSNLAGSRDKVYFGYAIYHTMGKLVEMNTDDSIVRTGLPLTVNGPMFSFMLANHSQVPAGSPIYIRLKLASPQNRTNLQCAMWIPGSNGPGVWSASDCSVFDTDCQVRAHSDECEEVYITCQCNHLSTYAIIVDEDGAVAKAAVIELQVVMYVLVVVSLVLLVLAFFILISYKALQTNWNSIHTNLVFVIIICELAFTVGINRTSPELFCRLVAISLHYFYMSAFAWLYVEVLHIYRMLTEKQTINYGSMKFYYLLGYVIPGIIVGLAVGLYTEGYGNESFCWLETSQMFIWSFAGPIVTVVVINIITFMLAVKASCREKAPVADISSIRLGLLGAITLLLLLSVTWVLGLLSVNFDDIPALAYVHTVFLFLQGNFLFVIFILLSKKVRLCLKRTWFKLQGKKLDMEENLTGTRSSVMSRSALAYRNDTASSTEGGLRINVGISTTSTTSQSSKSTGRYPPRFRDDFGRSTSSSTSGGHIPSASGQPPNTGVAPYGYSPNVGDVVAEEPYEGPSPAKPEGNDSDSDSDASMDRNSLDLASSHSSDEDDDFEIGPPWDQHIPKSKAVAQAREQLEKHKKDKERERIGNNNSDPPMWVDSGQVDISVDHDPPPTSRPHISSVPPDVTLSAAAQRSGRKVTIKPPVRSDSLQNNYATSSSNVASEVAPATSRVQVQVLTHNGSLSSDSESSDETNV